MQTEFSVACSIRLDIPTVFDQILTPASFRKICLLLMTERQQINSFESLTNPIRTHVSGIPVAYSSEKGSRLFVSLFMSRRPRSCSCRCEITERKPKEVATHEYSASTRARLASPRKGQSFPACAYSSP